MKNWQIENDKSTGEPYLRLWMDNVRTPALIKYKYLDRENSSVPKNIISQFDQAYKAWLNKTF